MRQKTRQRGSKLWSITTSLKDKEAPQTAMFAKLILILATRLGEASGVGAVLPGYGAAWMLEVPTVAKPCLLHSLFSNQGYHFTTSSSGRGS